MRKSKPAKIKYIGYLATSIDGRIAKSENSGTDWTSKEDWNFFQNSLKKFDAVIAGYNTYKVSKNSIRSRNAIILTSKVKELKIKNKIIFLNPERTNLKKFISTTNYKKIAVLGGGHVYDFCLRNNMLDELFVTIEPYIFTNGVSMFPGSKFKKNKFILQSIKKLNKNGTILLKYKNASQSNQN